MNKRVLLLLASSILLLLNGCVRVDTNPQPTFHQIHEHMQELTGYDIYWDASLKELIDEILKRELTDDHAVQLALLNNPHLQAVYETLGIAKAQLAQAGLLKNPIFSLSYRFSTHSSITDLIDMSLMQNFLEILLIPLKKKMAQAELEETKAMVLTQILDVIAETKIAFYSLQASQKIWDLKKQVLLASELSYEAAQKLFEVGNIKDLEVSMERSLYEQAKLEVASWEIIVLEAKEKLNVLMGLWGNQIEWTFASHFPESPDEENNFKDIENEAIAKSIDLQVAYQRLLTTAAQFGIDTSKLVFPQFDLGVSSEREESTWFVGPAVNLAIPLFDFGQANSAKARAKILQQWNQYTALAIEIRSKARSSRFFLLNAFRQSQYLKKVMIPLAEQITSFTHLQCNAMQLGVFHLLSAKKNELERKIQAVQMEKDYWISKVELQTLINGHIVGKRHE